MKTNQNDVYNLHPLLEENADINIVYHRATFYRRIMANCIDFFIFIILFILFFVANRAIFQSTDAYKIKNAYIAETREKSKLYQKDGQGELTDVVYILQNSDMDAAAKSIMMDSAIKGFIEYVKTDLSVENAEVIQKNYDKYRLELKNGDLNFFVTDKNGEISYNRNYGAGFYVDLNEKCYAPYLDNQCQGYLLQFAPRIIEYTHFFSIMYIFVIFPVGFILSGLLIWLIPPLIFKRGRKTIGKLVYRIGAVNKDFLNLSTGKFLARFAIFLFGVLMLSFVTLGIPMIISFSVMAFSKKRQSFPDYMLNIQEIDIAENKVFFSKNEIMLEHLNKDNSAENFKFIDRL